MKLRLIADQAIGKDQSDGLGFNAYARVLARAALDTPGPFTIGVFGEWGTGKTSLMSLIQSNLAEEPNVVTVWFNAWRYEKEEHPIVPLVGTIVRELETHKDFSQKLDDSGRKLIRALRAVAYGFSAKSTVKIPGFAEVEASFVAKDMIDREERLTPDPLLDRSLYFGAFNSLDTVHIEGDLRVVILIDDLDRCFPDQAIRLLESIKLVLAQRGFIFILGVARQVIEGYLQHRYLSDFGIQDFKGQLYLDKIVQLPFHIPPTAGRMVDFCKQILADQPTDVSTELDQILPTVAEALGGNPRAVIRFVNNILIDRAINSELADAQQMETIPLNYFAISRCLEDRWPEVFSILAKSTQLAHEVFSWDLSSVKGRAEGDDDEARIAASLVSDRRLAELLFGEHGKSWLEKSELRVASVEFLQDQRRTSSLDTAEAPVRYDAVFSYSREDQTYVVNIAQGLSERGLSVFFEVAAPVGSYSKELIAAFRKTRAICFCIGRTPPDQWQMGGLLGAADISDISVIGILLPGADTVSVPSELRKLGRIQWVDMHTEIHPVEISSLAEAILRLR